MTSEKLLVALERSSVELLEEGLRFSCRGGLEGTGGAAGEVRGERRLAVEAVEAVEVVARSGSLGITRAGEARTESDLGPGGAGGDGL